MWTVRTVTQNGNRLSAKDDKGFPTKRIAFKAAEAIRHGNRGKGSILRDGHMYIVRPGNN